MRRLFCAALLISICGATRAYPDVLVSYANLDSVLRFDETTGAFAGAFVPTGSAELKSPIGLALGPDQNIYVASYGNSSVLRYRWPTGEFLGSFCLGGNLTNISGLAFGPDNNLYVNSDGGLKKFNGTSGLFIGDVVPTTEKVTYFALAADGTPYATRASGFMTDGVSRYGSSGGDVLIQGGYLEWFGGLAFGPTGDLFVQASNSTFGPPLHEVRQYDSVSGDFLRVFAFDSSLNRYALHFGPE